MVIFNYQTANLIQLSASPTQFGAKIYYNPNQISIGGPRMLELGGPKMKDIEMKEGGSTGVRPRNFFFE